MSGVKITREVQAPVEEVFDAATNLRGAPERISGIERLEILTDGPIGQGTRFRETRKMFGKQASEEMEIVRFERPSGYALVAESSGCRYDTEFRFRPTAAGTEVEMSFNARPLTLGAKVMGTLMRPVMKSMIKRLCSQDLDDLKRSIETDH